MIVLASKSTIMMLTLVIAVGVLIVAIAAASLAMRPNRRYYDEYVPNNRRNGEKRDRKTTTK